MHVMKIGTKVINKLNWCSRFSVLPGSCNWYVPKKLHRVYISYKLIGRVAQTSY